ncbi:phage tail tape measure protein [Azonexus sp. R2A61]|uniref:phage tail tape measure protein n=1 Tax=Azonexus sp. R2A61 TaxID=2744443 RepID=UPI001F20F137|nr:phage tail tape measure protein [Azonexus sp. R2A61]
MSGELTASFVLRFNDQASANAARALRTIKQEMRDTAGESRKASQAAAEAASQLQQLGNVRMNRASIEWMQLLEQNAAKAQRSVGLLERSMQAAGRAAALAGKGLQGYAQAVGAAQAAKFVLADPVRQTMNYDRQLAGLANTAYAGQSLDARKAGMKELDGAIMGAVRDGGGTREGAMATLDKLVASGAFTDINEAKSLLPTLTKAGTAANADPTQLADIAIRAKQTFGLKDSGLALDQAIKAGQLGGFELKDMAKWLPQQMAMARLSGLKGDDGFRTLLAANQAAAITAGTKDEAGNNVVNLMGKINSRDTADDAKRLGIDLSGTLAAARAKGTNSLDAFVNLTQSLVGKDKRFSELQAKASNSTGDEQKAAYEAMGDIVQGSAIGKLVQDRQALMALVGIMGNQKYMNDIRGQLGNAKGTGDSAFELIAQTPSFKMEQAAAEKANAMQQALDRVNPLLGSAADGFSALAQNFPVATAATLALATAATAAAAALAGFAGVGAILGRGKAAADIAGAVAGAGAGGKAITGGRALLAMGKGLPLAAWGTMGAGGLATAAGGVVAAGAASYGVGTMLNSLINWGVSKATGREESLGGLIYELLHREKEPVKVEVSIRDGNLVAQVNEENGRQARRN